MGILTKVTSSLGNLFQDKWAENNVGSVLNNVTGVSDQMNKSYQQQLGAMQAQNDYNTQMWNLQNEYNSPASQLARMREAGIDVNPTAYALGSSNLSNTASSLTSENGFSVSGSPAGNPISMLMGMASGIQSIREAKARTANLKEQRINLMTEGNRLLNQVQTSRLNNEIARHNLKYAQEHNLPVNAVPGTDQSTAQLFNEFVTYLRNH